MRWDRASLDDLHYDLGTQRLLLSKTNVFFTDEFATLRARSSGNLFKNSLYLGF